MVKYISTAIFHLCRMQVPRVNVEDIVTDDVHTHALELHYTPGKSYCNSINSLPHSQQ